MNPEAQRHYERLRWRCRRGLLELDLVLQDVLEQRYRQLDAAERQAFERLLTLADSTLLAYWQGQERCQDREIQALVEQLR